MINLSYRPIRFETKNRKDFEYPYNRDISLKEYLDKTKVDYSKCDIIVNGKVETNFNKRLDNEDEIIITPKIEGPVGAALWTFAGWFGVETLLGAIVFYAGIMAAAYSVYSAITTRNRLPNFGLDGYGIDESSPTYGWEGIRTIQEVSVPVKIVYGEHRTGGNIINQYISTDGDKQYLNLLIAICEGEIEEISNIKINELPVSNFEGIETETRLGTNDQSVIANFADLHNLYPVNIELTKDNSYIYTTIDSDVEGFDINFTAPSGLYQVDSSNGSINSWDITYKVEYKLHSEEEYTDLGTTTISAKTRTTLRRTFSKRGLSAGQYDIRITRTSDNTSLSPQKIGDLYLASIDEIKTDDLAYPNTALISIKALATEQLSGATPNITFVVKGKKVRIPKILTEEAGEEVNWEDYYWDDDDEKWRLFSNDSELYWDEVTYVERWSANPIWCLRDLQTNTRYGLGENIESENLDEAELLEMAKFCETEIEDGEGGYQKRFRLDLVLDSASKAPDIISQITATFRAFMFYSNNGYSFRIDKQELPVQMFGMGNIIKNQFLQNWKSRNEIYNLIEARINDRDNDYKDDTVSVMDEESLSLGEPIKKNSIRLFTAYKSYAIREARYALWASKYINRTIQIRCGIDAIACKAGDVINIAHDVPQWGFSGRIRINSTTTIINLDQTVTIEPAKTYKLMIRFSDDTIEEKTVITPAGNYSSLEVSEAFSKTPQNYDIYSFGESNKVIKPFRVMNISRANDGECSILAIEYNESVYDDSGIVLPTNNYSALTYTIPNITDLKLTERLVKLSDGTIENVIDVWFNRPSLVSHYVRRYYKAKIYISDNGGESWIERGETTDTHFSIMGDIIDLLEYKVAVVSVGDIGDENPISASPQASITIIGKTALPSDISNFIINQVRDKLYFGWVNVSDIDLDSYEIRYGDSWEAGYVIASRIKTNRLIILDFRTGESQSFWIKAIDTSGNYSENATEAIITIDSIPFQNIVESYSEQHYWLGDLDNLVKNYEGNILTEDENNFITEDSEYLLTEIFTGSISIAEGELSGTYITPVRDLGYIANFKIGINPVVVIADEATWQDFGEQTFADMPETYRFSGEEAGEAASFEIRTSDDNITWSEWQTWQAGDYTCRYFQIRMTLTRLNVAQDLVCAELNSYADLPDIDDKLEGEVTVAEDGADLVFTKEFHKVYGVQITIISGDGIYYKVNDLDLIGCNIKLYDAEGTAQTGDFLAHIHGI